MCNVLYFHMQTPSARVIKKSALFTNEEKTKNIFSLHGKAGFPRMHLFSMFCNPMYSR